MPTPQDISDAKDLLLAAFESARASGKRDWNSMTAAVLKNRLLQLTSRSFDETALGFERFIDLLDAMPDVVEVDRTARPPLVRLVASLRDAADPVLSLSSPTTRVRPDLWHGIVDYASERPWVWDTEAGRARPAEDSDNLPMLPTITQDEMAGMRGTFAEQFDAPVDDPEVADRLRQWAHEGRGAFVLPPDVRHHWNAALKKEVAERLEEFFNGLGVAVPNDALQAPSTASRRPQADDDLARLRAMVVEVVRAMTLAELSELPLPAAAVLRSQSRAARASR